MTSQAQINFEDISIEEAPTKEALNALEKEVEAYYDYCYKVWYGDVSDKAYFMEMVFWGFGRGTDQ